MNQYEETEKQNTIRVLLVPPNDYPREVEIGSDLKSLQEAVGGDIEATYPFGDSAAIILNENGKLIGLPPNRMLCSEDGRPYDVIAGQFLVAGLGEEDFCSLTNEQMKAYEKKFHQPEAFMKLGRSVMVMKLTDEMVENMRTSTEKDGRNSRHDQER